MYLWLWSWTRQSSKLQTECQNGKESNFERGMDVVARWAGMSISQSAQLLGFSRTTISRVYKGWCEKGKNIHYVAVQMVESEFGINRRKTWIHHAFLPLCRLMVVV